MAVHTITKGLDLPITGDPQQRIDESRSVRHVAVVAPDYVGMRPRMQCKVGDDVKRGTPLFDDRKTEGVVYTAPGAGRITAINRGEFRVLQTVVIELSDSEREGKVAADEQVSFENYKGTKPADLKRDEVVALMVEAGVWPALRQRPFGRVPAPKGDAPSALYVTAADTNPLAPDVDKVLEGKTAAFEAGLTALSKLSGGKTYLCKMAGSKVSAGSAKGVSVEEFKGPHPAGTVGLHIHTIDPVCREKVAWHIGYQDVVQVGQLFLDGTLNVERVVSLAGPVVDKPRLLRTRMGAKFDELVDGELAEGENRIISGSVLSGRTAQGDSEGYLGRYHNQISALHEGRERKLFGWLTPGFEFFSVSGAFASSVQKGKKFDFTTNLNGSPRAMVPIGMFERVFPFDILPTFLLRAILVQDLGRAEELGLLELEEEDLALCTFVAPGKHDFGKVIRENLDQIWKEG